MTGINHMLTGGIIGASIASPAVIPIAFMSHFVLDMLPHYGIGDGVARSKDWVWKLDGVLIAGFISYLSVIGTDVRIWSIVGALVAASPDMAWVYRFSVKERFGAKKPQPSRNRFNKFHADIQTRESEARLWIEAVFLVVLSTVFMGFIV